MNFLLNRLPRPPRWWLPLWWKVMAKDKLLKQAFIPLAKAIDNYYINIFKIHPIPKSLTGMHNNWGSEQWAMSRHAKGKTLANFKSPFGHWKIPSINNGRWEWRIFFVIPSNCRMSLYTTPFYTFSSIYLRRTVLWHSVKCDDIDIDRDIDLQMTLGHNHL